MSTPVRCDTAPEDRRRGYRFPIESELCYAFVRRNGAVGVGRGWTVDLSSCGILFRSDAAVPAGMEIELSIAWPCKLAGTVRMQLRVFGQTVRQQGDCTGVRIFRYEFKTGGVRQPRVRESASAIPA